MAALIEDKVFWVHGGLSPSINVFDDIRKLDRKQEVPRDGPMSNILWCDPDNDVKTYWFSPRGAGFLFGEDDVKTFNHENNIDLISKHIN